MACAICETRKPRRVCPARGDICAQCCGEQREVTIDCPLNCEHLIEARKHEKPIEFADRDALHSDVSVSEAFLANNEMLLTFLSVCLRDGAMASPGCTDADVREAMDAMIRTYKTADSGLIYETKPANPFASKIQESVNASIAQLKEQVYKETGTTRLRDSDLLRSLVFLIRVAQHLDNGRRKCRAFLSMLTTRFPPRHPAAASGEPPTAESSSSLLITP